MLSVLEKYLGISSYSSISNVELLDNWISDVPICISIPEYDKKFKKYHILIEHGSFKWSVYRKDAEIRSLKYTFYRGSFLKYFINWIFGFNNELPTFIDSFWKSMNTDYIFKVEKYLQNLVNDIKLRNHPRLLHFFQVSYMSFNTEYGHQKGLEGLARKKSCRVSPNWFNLCFEQWEPCWIVLKDDYLVCLNTKFMTVDGVMLLDHTVQIDVLQNRSIMILNKTRIFQLEFEDSDKNLWLSYLKETVSRFRACLNNKLSFDLKDDVIQNHKFDSFMPPREKSRCRWIIDGAKYFAKVADALCAAQKEIFISAWWLSPQIYLKRPLINSSDIWRFDNIIKRKAGEGVKIYILLYKEIPAAMGLQSSYSKKILKNLHPHNIYVLRHPYHLRNSVYFWSHHEKIVCVDQRIVFIGGLDICYGRWDSKEHELVDLGPSDGPILGPSLMKSITKITSPDHIMEEHYFKYRKNLKGEDAKVKLNRARLIMSVARTFANKHKLNNSNITQETKTRDFKVSRMFEKSISIRGDPEGTDLSEVNFLGSGKYWIGKDYSNFIYKDFDELDEPFTDLIDREKIPRMPWHDIAVVLFDQAAKDVARHFIERWNQTLFEKYKPNIPYLLPKNYFHLSQFPIQLKTNTEHCSVQICRSSTTWSAGLKRTENSIENAYVALIEKSKYFIYIENQFFISIHDHSTVRNRISDAIFKRLNLAISNHETFRVYIVMPLLPGFEGEIGEKTGTFIETMIYWTNLSLNMGPNSLIQRLTAIVDDPFQYISICGLRKYDMLRQTLVSELIYVHSKLLIIDDEMCIIGSANINDRSLLGDRDSEIAAIIVENHNLINGLMNNKIVKTGKFVSSLRKTLFKEHLMWLNGMDDFNVEDPICDHFFKAWNKRASINTKIYEEVFRCIPTNQVKSFKELRMYRKTPSLAQTDIPLAIEKLKDIKGALVHYPLNFFIEDIGESDSKTKMILSALGCDSPFSILYT